jgi:hypothetical protein
MLKLGISVMILGASLLTGASWAEDKEQTGKKAEPAATPAPSSVQSLVAAGQSASSNASTAANDKPGKVNASDYVKDGVACGVPGLQTTTGQ